jgi:hypothetical protein
MTDTPNERSYLPPEELPFTTSYLAIASLFLGVLSWVLIPFFCGLLAVALGHMARIEVARSAGKLTGDGMAVVGLVLGYSNIIAAACIVVCIASFFLLPALEQFLS